MLAEELEGADILIGGVLVPGGIAPKLVTREMVRSMGPGAVIVDVCIDQGGIAVTSRPTSHDDPVYVEEGVIHYCVPNMPGAVPRTSTEAMTGATLPYVMKLAAGGLAQQSNQLDRQQNGEQGNEGRARSARELAQHRTLKGQPARHFDFFEGEKG